VINKILIIFVVALLAFSFLYTMSLLAVNSKRIDLLEQGHITQIEDKAHRSDLMLERMAAARKAAQAKRDEEQ